MLDPKEWKMTANVPDGRGLVSRLLILVVVVMAVAMGTDAWGMVAFLAAAFDKLSLLLSAL